MKIQSNTQNFINYKKYLQVIKNIEQFLDSRGYLKLELPVLSPALIPESYLEVFKTEFRYFETDEKLFLTPSPELFIKRLLSDGIGDCYFLGNLFEILNPIHQSTSQSLLCLSFIT